MAITKFVAPALALSMVMATVTPSLAQKGAPTPEPRVESAMEMANRMGVCGERDVVSATFQPDNTLSVQCGGADGMIGGLGIGIGAAAAIGAIIVAASSGGGGGTTSTTSTTATTATSTTGTGD